MRQKTIYREPPPTGAFTRQTRPDSEPVDTSSRAHNYYGTTRTLDQAIVQLRKKLGDNGDDPKHLLTVHGVGYKLALLRAGLPIAISAPVHPLPRAFWLPAGS